MADSSILAAGGDDAPLSYLVPGSAVITIKQVHVSYVDNGAGADWLPAVRIVNDAGHTMGTAADQAVKVTAGDDADVSFFPGVKHAAAATPLGPGFVQYAYTPGVGQTVNAGVGASVQFDNTEFVTNSPTVFSQASLTDLTFLLPGHYLTICAYQVQAAAMFATTLVGEMAHILDPGFPASFTLSSKFLQGVAAQSLAMDYYYTMWTLDNGVYPPPGTLRHRYVNHTAANHDLFPGLWLFRFDDGTDLLR